MGRRWAGRDAPPASGESRESSFANLLIESVADTTAHRDRESLNGGVARLLRDYLDAEAVTLFRFIDDGSVTRLAALVAATRDEPQLSTDAPGEPATLPALGDEPSWHDCVRLRQVVQYVDADGRSAAAFPIESEREVIGMLLLEGVGELQSRDVHLVGAILRILKNHIELLDYGERDTLTHLLNRRTFELRFEKLQRRRSDSPAVTEAMEPDCWLGLLDIDKFKSINDSHGHRFGDEVLLLISRLMQECFRGADQLFRFGGEEFVIMLDRTTANGAQIAFERLREAVQTRSFPDGGQVTVSLGYSQIRAGEAPATCVERADAALYYAKQHGRNRVCHFEALVESGELIDKAAEGRTQRIEGA